MPASELAHQVSCLVFKALCRWSLVYIFLPYAIPLNPQCSQLENPKLLLWCIYLPSSLLLSCLISPFISCSCLSHTLSSQAPDFEGLGITPMLKFPMSASTKGGTLVLYPQLLLPLPLSPWVQASVGVSSLSSDGYCQLLLL